MDRSEQEIFVQAFKDYEKSLLRRSFSKVSDKMLADDLVQTTFLKTWEYLLREGKINSMKAFLFHVLNNLIIDEYRKDKPISLDAMTEKGFEISIDETDRLYNEIDGRTAMVLIPLLEEKYRKVVSMRFLEDMDLKEIAAITNQPKNTVSVQIHRGIEKLAILFRIEDEKTTDESQSDFSASPANH
jgi:RNA polymerase sigma-70 factor (ECF subfamily)